MRISFLDFLVIGIIAGMHSDHQMKMIPHSQALFACPLFMMNASTEPAKIRPVLIIQCQALLDVEHPSTLIIPLTTNLIDDAEPLRCRIPAAGKLKKKSDLLIDQLRAIDNKRLVNGPLLKCSPALMSRIDQYVREILELSL